MIHHIINSKGETIADHITKSCILKHEKLKSKENNLQISLHEMLAKDTP